MNARQRTTQETGSLTRAIHWFGAISIIPGIILPFYQYFIHGGRDAASIMQHPAEHATAHVVAALCFFLLLFGLIAVFITHAEKIGRFGLVSFILTFLFIAFYGGLLIMDAFTNAILAKYQPVLQEQWHSAIMGLDTPLTELLGPALFTAPIAMILLLFSSIIFGIVLIRAKILPWYVGALFIIGGLVLGTGAMLPYRIVVIGYGGIGFGAALDLAKVGIRSKLTMAFRRTFQTLAPRTGRY